MVTPLSRQDVEEMLTELAKKPIDKKLAVGAMCYSVAAPHFQDIYTYICPNCNEKTLYTNIFAGIVKQEIPLCKRLLKDFDKNFIFLDESQFCKICNPEIENPSLLLKIKFNKEKEIFIFNNINSFDLKLLIEFFSGNNILKEMTGTEYPLKNYIPRIKEILGIKS
jgi:hypothetical protein